jgi:hypothetical protein
MFFIYPAFLYVSILGITNTKPSLKKIFIALLLINILLVSVSMIRNHPYQNLYFNELAGNKSTIYQRFELDYWGLSYRKALEYVAEIDKRENIRIRVKGLPGETNVIMLDPMDRKRISTSENIDNPHYYITNYRGEEERDQNNLIYTIFVEKNPIIGVYKYK